MTRKTLLATAALMGLVAMQPAAVLAEAAGKAAEPVARAAAAPAAEATSPAADAAQAAATDDALEQASRAGFQAVQLMGAALRALADEQRDIADQALARAEQLLDGVAGAVPATDGDAAMLPIYSKVNLVTESEPTDEQKGHFAEAQEHMKAGDNAAALAALKAGGARFGVTRYLLPVAPTAGHVKAARAAIADDKASDAMSRLVEANRELKADYKVVEIPS